MFNLDVATGSLNLFDMFYPFVPSCLKYILMNIPNKDPKDKKGFHFLKKIISWPWVTPRQPSLAHWFNQLKTNGQKKVIKVMNWSIYTVILSFAGNHEDIRVFCDHVNFWEPIQVQGTGNLCGRISFGWDGWSVTTSCFEKNLKICFFFTWKRKS